MIALAVVAGIVLFFAGKRRLRRSADRKDALLVSREDRTGHFARRPGRLRGRPGL